MQDDTLNTPDENEMKDENKRRKPGTSRTEVPARDDIDRGMDDRFWADPVDFFRNLPRLPNQIRRSMFPRVDVSETDAEVKVVADIPGVDPDDMYIDVRNNRMILKGKVDKETETDSNSRPYKYERMYGEFRREFSLPAPVDEEQVKASYKNGILTVTMPKIENTRKGRIKIERK